MAFVGFEELGGDGLISWLGNWVGDVAGTVPVETGGTADIGRLSVSVQGELIQVELTAAARDVRAADLSEAIERAYRGAYHAALLQLDQILERITHDVNEDPVLVDRIKQLRSNYADINGLKAMLKRRQDRQRAKTAPEWDDGASVEISDPLRRRT
jgi:hypothetical protein